MNLFRDVELINNAFVIYFCIFMFFDIDIIITWIMEEIDIDGKLVCKIGRDSIHFPCTSSVRHGLYNPNEDYRVMQISCEVKKSNQKGSN